jgi:hypothetical protein
MIDVTQSISTKPSDDGTDWTVETVDNIQRDLLENK